MTLWDTANHRNDEAPAGVELTRPGVTADVHINKWRECGSGSDRRWLRNSEMGKDLTGVGEGDDLVFQSRGVWSSV